MTNPGRTTKPERRAVRRYNRYAVRVLGVAEAARWHRDGILLDEAEGFEHMLAEMFPGTRYDRRHDRAPVDLTPNTLRMLGLIEGDDVANIGAGTVPADAASRERVERMVAAAEANLYNPERLATVWRNWVLYGEMTSPMGRFNAIRRPDGSAAIIDQANDSAPSAPRMNGYNPGFVIIDEPNPDEDPFPTVESVEVEPDGFLTLTYARDPFEADAARAEAIDHMLEKDYDDE